MYLLGIKYDECCMMFENDEYVNIMCLTEHVIALASVITKFLVLMCIPCVFYNVIISNVAYK